MKIVVAPDKFKGSLPGAEVVTIPVADGGEGSLDAQSLAGKTPVGVARAAARPGTASESSWWPGPAR